MSKRQGQQERDMACHKIAVAREKPRGGMYATGIVKAVTGALCDRIRYMKQGQFMCVSTHAMVVYDCRKQAQ